MIHRRRPPTMCMTMMMCLAAASTASAQDAATEDPMRPTELGLRMTPGIARGAARLWLGEIYDKDSKLTDRERSRLVDAVARRAMKLGHRGATAGARMIEAVAEHELATSQPAEVIQERGRRFGGYGVELSPHLQEFFDAVGQDAREILPPEKLGPMEKELDKLSGNLTKFQEQMQRWERGEREENEDPFDVFDEEPENQNDTGEEGSDEPENEEAKARRQAVEQAKDMLEWDLRRLPPREWDQFLRGAQYFFKMTQTQSDQGQAILDDYSRQAEAVMTPEWMRAFRLNRLKHNLQHHLGELNGGPWMYQLEREHKELTKPLDELEIAFQTAILNLTTADQRRAAIEKVRAIAEKHGMTFYDSDVQALGLPLPEDAPADTEPAPTDGETVQETPEPTAEETTEPQE